MSDTDEDEERMILAVRARLAECIAENGLEHYCHYDVAVLLGLTAEETE